MEIIDMVVIQNACYEANVLLTSFSSDEGQKKITWFPFDNRFRVSWEDDKGEGSLDFTGDPCSAIDKYNSILTNEESITF